ncbi:MAG: hypothetical protein Q9166_004282 [cf. Caloplaca sp. 2 TL-2023]
MATIVTLKHGSSSPLMYTKAKIDRRRLKFKDVFGGEYTTTYRKRGYNLTHVGDLYKNARYKVIHKLGWGGFAAVWLARDQENRYVALKIILADKSREKPELTMLEHLAAQK